MTAPAQIYLTPGSLWCGPGEAVVSTVLGSCISVCLFDRHRRGAGMNHYVLPSSQGRENSLRYADVALDRMLARLRQLGCEPEDLRAKVFGGAAVLPYGTGDTIGTKNTRTAMEWLRVHAIPVTARRTGGTDGLLIRFFTGSGEVLVRRVVSGIEISVDGPAPSSNSHQNADGGAAS